MSPRQTVEVGKGIVKGAVHTAADLGELVQKIPGVTRATDALYGLPAGGSETAMQAARDATQYSNTAQQVGGGLETAAEMTIPLGEAAKVIPTKAKAKPLFQGVMAAAKDVPLDVSKLGDSALKLADFAQHGGGTNWGPGPVRQLIQYLTDPSKPALTYEVGRDFATNIGNLSSKDWASINKPMGRLVADVAAQLNLANANAAKSAGQGAEYLKAMKLYRQASQIRAVFDSFLEGAKKAAPYAGAAALGTGFVYKLRALLGE
jgi:hypothetical protein